MAVTADKTAAPKATAAKKTATAKAAEGTVPAETGQTVKLMVPPLVLGKLRIQIVGDTSLVCNKFSEKAKNMILDKQMGQAKIGRENKSPSNDFINALHVMPNADGTPGVPILHDERAAEGYTWAEGRFGFPAIGLKAAAVRAATDAGLKMTDMRRSFRIPTELVEITNVNHNGDNGPIMRMDMVRVGMGTADVRFRPEFENWSIEFDLEYNSQVINTAQIVNLFRLAGFGVGIGEWRTEKEGLWGGFHVGKVMELPSEDFSH